MMATETGAKKTGWYTWLHHDRPVEYTWDLDERLKYIQTAKQPHEVPQRLASIIQVEDEGRIPLELRQAEEAHQQAEEAYHQAKEACRQAEHACRQAEHTCRQAEHTYRQARDAYHQARDAYEQAELAYHRARDAYHQAWSKHHEGLLALALELAPLAPYDKEQECLVFGKVNVKAFARGSDGWNVKE